MKQSQHFLSCIEKLSEKEETSLKSLLSSADYVSNQGELIVPIGITEEQKVFCQDLSIIPHILISGTTGSGKTVFIQSVLSALMLRYEPEECRFVIYDSKRVDYAVFNSSQNLLIPIITAPKKALDILEWLNNEAFRRIGLKEQGETLEDVPDIFFIIDDYSDLPNDEYATKELFSVLKLGRTVKIHCIISTSTPTSKIISTELKANILCRIAFATASKMDSRIIIDDAGAETLQVPGEIIFKGQNQKIKCKCLYVPQEEIETVLDYNNRIDSGVNSLGQKAHELFSGQNKSSYDRSAMDFIEQKERTERFQKTGLFETENDLPPEDPMLDEAIKAVLENGLASTSLLQRKLKLGYARAARIIDIMEERGIIGPYEGANPRKILMTKEQLIREISDTEKFEKKSMFNERDVHNKDQNKTKPFLKSFPITESFGSYISVSGTEIEIIKPVTVNGRKGRYTYTFSGDMIQQLIYKKASLFIKGYITFVVVAENMIIRENGQEKKVPITVPSIPITINFNKNNDAVFSKLILQVSEDINLEIDTIH